MHEEPSQGHRSRREGNTVGVRGDELADAAADHDAKANAQQRDAHQEPARGAKRLQSRRHAAREMKERMEVGTCSQPGLNKSRA